MGKPGVFVFSVLKFPVKRFHPGFFVMWKNSERSKEGFGKA